MNSRYLLFVLVDEPGLTGPLRRPGRGPALLDLPGLIQRPDRQPLAPPAAAGSLVQAGHREPAHHAHPRGRIPRQPCSAAARWGPASGPRRAQRSSSRSASAARCSPRRRTSRPAATAPPEQKHGLGGPSNSPRLRLPRRAPILTAAAASVLLSSQTHDREAAARLPRPGYLRLITGHNPNGCCRTSFRDSRHAGGPRARPGRSRSLLTGLRHTAGPATPPFHGSLCSFLVEDDLPAGRRRAPPFLLALVPQSPAHPPGGDTRLSITRRRGAPGCRSDVRVIEHELITSPSGDILVATVQARAGRRPDSSGPDSRR